MRVNGQPDASFRNFEYRSPRLPAEFPFWLQIESEATGIVAGSCTDVSDKGLGADVEESLPVGSQVMLLLPSALRSEPFVIRARVVSQQAQRYGFAFLPAQPGDTEEIAAIIRMLSEGGTQSSSNEL